MPVMKTTDGDQDGKLRVSQDAVFTRFEADGDGVLLNLRTKTYYTLNETAALIWMHLERGDDLETISAVLTENFEVGDDVARFSVEELLSELEREGLVESGPPPGDNV